VIETFREDEVKTKKWEWGSFEDIKNWGSRSGRQRKKEQPIKTGRLPEARVRGKKFERRQVGTAYSQWRSNPVH